MRIARVHQLTHSLHWKCLFAFEQVCDEAVLQTLWAQQVTINLRHDPKHFYKSLHPLHAFRIVIKVQFSIKNPTQGLSDPRLNFNQVRTGISCMVQLLVVVCRIFYGKLVRCFTSICHQINDLEHYCGF